MSALRDLLLLVEAKWGEGHVAEAEKELAALVADNAALLQERLRMCPTCSGVGTYPVESPNGTEMYDAPCPSCAPARNVSRPGAALLERVSRLEAVVDGFRAVEWQRGDWQIFCVFRRAVGCHGTDGVVSAFGAPLPKPHDECCPFSKLAALESKP